MGASEFKATHTGIAVERRAGRSNHDIRQRIPLRETAMFFVTRRGTRFSKKHGRATGAKGLFVVLDVATVQAVGHE